jgi:F-type H+-transporting ATPase subunit b
MIEFLGKLGIDLKMLLAQIINFGLLLFILNKFLYQPILKRIKKDSEELGKVEEQKKELKKDISEFKQEDEKELSEAKKQSRRIISDAEEMAEKIRSEAMKQANEEKIEIVRQIRKRLTEVKDGKG